MCLAGRKRGEFVGQLGNAFCSTNSFDMSAFPVPLGPAPYSVPQTSQNIVCGPEIGPLCHSSAWSLTLKFLPPHDREPLAA